MCESSLITQSLVNYSESRSDPTCGAALGMYGTVHLLPGEDRLCVSVGAVNV